MAELAILGGKPAVTIKDPERWRPPIEEEKRAVCELIEERFLSGSGTGLPKQFEEEFREEHGIRLKFSEGALRWIEEEAEGRGTEPSQLCRELLKDYGYGLKLVNAEEFEVTEEVLKDPKGFLDRLIKSFYAEASS